MLADIDASKARAFVEQDEPLIIARMKDEVGIGMVNEMICLRLREWFSDAEFSMMECDSLLRHPCIC